MLEPTAAASGSKRRRVDDTEDPFEACISPKRANLAVEVEEAAVKESVLEGNLWPFEPATLPTIRISLRSPPNRKFWPRKFLSADEIDVLFMEVEMEPLFAPLVYRPSRLSVSVVMDETECDDELRLDKSRYTSKFKLWESSHAQELRDCGKKEAERIRELKTDEEMEAELKDCLLADMA
ncbi:hypothetical protein HDU81_008526 [Chytriomyces hyalinus]|nr:hypothetical protein HDU81_008526 [Chytriomyces hyalinus]